MARVSGAWLSAILMASMVVATLAADPNRGTASSPAAPGQETDGIETAAPTATPTETTPTTIPTTTTIPATTTVPTTTTIPTTTIPTTTIPTTTVPPRGRLVINAVGDVNVDPGYIPALAAEGYDYALAGLDGLFLEDDLTIINLECPVSELGTIVPKQFNFRCDVAALPALRRHGVDVANLGNNHILDYGPDAMLDSLVQLNAAGIAPVGVGENAAAAAEPAVFSINGWTVAVVGFGGVVPAANWIATEDRPGMADGDTIETMAATVRAAAAVADIVAVTIHWGVELQSGPPADDVRRAEAMVEAGADMIFGHHPHRLNALELIDGKPVSWSLGNFVWPRLSAAGSDTAVAQVIVEPDGELVACYLDATIVSNGRPELDDPTVRSCR